MNTQSTMELPTCSTDLTSSSKIPVHVSSMPALLAFLQQRLRQQIRSNDSC